MTQPASRWDPFREFEDLYGQMGRLWETAFGAGASGTPAWAPLADVSETDDAYVVEVDLPGVKRDDVNINLDGDELSVTGEVKDVEREGQFRTRTRRTGAFGYRVTLPRNVDADNIAAGLVDGVLTIRVPKADAAKPRRIRIDD